MNGAGASGPHVVGQDRDDCAAAAARNHVLPDCARAIEAAVEDDPDHRVPAIRRQVLGLADEVAGGIVDEDVDAAEVTDRPLDHLVDLLRVAHVDLHGQGIEAGVPQLRTSLLEVLRVAAADHNTCAEFAETFRNREPQPGASTGDNGDLALEQIRNEHEDQNMTDAKISGW